MSAAKSSGRSAARTWLVRGAIALVVGLGFGLGAGVFTVNTLEPGRPNSVDSLQVMLDSIAKGRITPPEAAPAAPVEPAVAPEPAPPANGDSVAVPVLVELEEGAARNAILDAGLQVGEVRFQASTKPAGTVLASTPAGGTMTLRNNAVVLVLSDGRPPTDTLSPFSVPSSFPTP